MADGTVKDIEDEIPFELPEGWAWCHFGDIATVINGKNQSKVENPNGKYPIYGSGGIMGRADDYICLKNCTIIGRKGSINNPIFVEENFWNVDTAFGLYPSKNVLPKHLFYFCKYFDFTKLDSSTTLPSLTKTNIQRILFPLPPLTEQERIVSEIENTFAKIDILEQNQAELQTSIKQAKSKILDLAIHGKLVAQDPNDEPASVLLEKLRAEKEAKIKSGELKRDKNDSYIYKSATDNCHYEKFNDGSICEIEIPFEIPESWSWSRLGSICDYGKCKNASSDELSEDSWILDLEDIEKGTGKILKFVHFKDRKSLSTKHIFYKGDLLYSKLRPYLNKVVIAPKDGFCTSEILPLDFKGILTNKYGHYLFMSSFFLKIVNFLTYGVKMPRLGTDDARKILIPIPPIPEQKRIIEKIEYAFAQLDEIVLNFI